MSIVVNYPARIDSYQVSLGRDRATVALTGTEVTGGSPRLVGRMAFVTELTRSEDFINRGGFLEIERPLAVLSAALDLLRHEHPVFLHADGELSTSAEPAGEGELAAGA